MPGARRPAAGHRRHRDRRRCSPSTTPGTGRTPRSPATADSRRRSRRTGQRDLPAAVPAPARSRRRPTPRSWCRRSRSAGRPGWAWTSAGVHDRRPGLDRRHRRAAAAAGLLPASQFHTSDQGDFESLVRQLTPTHARRGLGQRPMAVDDPMPGVPSAGAPLGLDGALAEPVDHDDDVERPGQDAFQTARARRWSTGTAPLADDPDRRPRPADRAADLRPLAGRASTRVARRGTGLARRAQPRPAQPHRRRGWAPRSCRPADRADGLGLAAGRRRRAGQRSCCAQAQLARAALTMLHAQHLSSPRPARRCSR